MPWGIATAAVVGAGASIYSSNQANKTMKNASDSSIAEQQRQFDATNKNFAPYRESGTNALYRLDDLMGIGRAGPTAPTRDQFTTVNGQPQAARSTWDKLSTDIPAKASDPLGILGDKVNLVNQSISGGLLGRSKKKSQQQASPVFDQAGYDAAMRKYNDDQTAFQNRPTGQALLESTPGYQFRMDQSNQALNRGQAASGITGGAAAKEAMRYGQGFATNEQQTLFNQLSGMAGTGQTATAQTGAFGANAANTISSNMMNAGQYMGNQNYNMGANVNNAFQGGVQNYWTMKSYNDMMSRFKPGMGQQSSNPNYTPYGSSSPYNNAFDNPSNYG